MVSNDNQERSQKLLDPKRSINELRAIMDSEVNFENDDDISRAIFFHLNSFKGIDEEIKSVRFLLDKIDDLETSRKITIKASKDFNRSVWGFPDKTDSLELGFLTKSQFYSKSHNSSFFKPPFALNSFV